MNEIMNESHLLNLYFADREEPRSAFHRMVQTRFEHPMSGNYCIHFHGAGGIGKTSLLEQLKQEVRKKKYTYIKPIILSLDFEDPSIREPHRAVTRIYEQLKNQRSTWTFPTFSEAEFIYRYKTNGWSTDQEKRSFFDQYPSFVNVLEIAENLPVVGQGIGIVSDFVNTILSVKQRIGLKRLETKALNDSRPSEAIIDSLSEYLCRDIRNNVENDNSHLIMLFIDTYEKHNLIENLHLRKNPYPAWLETLTKRMPNTVCIIAGRDLIDWSTDPYWNNHFEPHVLDLLSENDSITVLHQSGIVDEKLCSSIYQQTSGDPFHLELCIKQYNRMCNNGIIPTEKDFRETTKEVVIRIINELQTDQLRYAFKIMGALSIWDYDLLNQCAIQLNCPLTPEQYKEIVTQCVISKVPTEHTSPYDSLYEMHDRQAALLREEIDPQSSVLQLGCIVE